MSPHGAPVDSRRTRSSISAPAHSRPPRLSRSGLRGHWPDNISACACRHFLYPVGISTHITVLARPAGEAVALTVVITAAAVTVPVCVENQGTGFRYIRLQLPDMAGLPHPGLYIRAVLSTVLRKLCCMMFKPRTFGVVFRMVLQGTGTQMAAVAVIRRGLRVRRPLPSRAINDFAYIVVLSLPPDDTQASAVPVRAAWQGEWRFSYALAGRYGWWSAPEYRKVTVVQVRRWV
nr:Hypothetical_protein [Citrobacter youngae]